MRGPLTDATYRRLFSAQVVALVGAGITTVALALLAHDLGGDDAGVVLGAALALKMVAYVALSPLIAAYADLADRRRLLVGLDLGRAASVAVLPLVSQLWQVFALIFIVSACSAGFTPAFQATIPDVLPDERDYTRALSLSRLTYDLQELLSPALAAGLLLIMSFDGLFVLNGAAFMVSAALVASTRLPVRHRGFTGDGRRASVTGGVRAFLRIDRLRGLLALDVAVASASAFVIVNTVILVREDLGGDPSAVAVAFGAAGAGSMIVALVLPRVLDRVSDRPLMLAGGVLLAAGLAAVPLASAYPALLGLWFLLGAGLSLIQTPTGRLLRRSGGQDELFAAQFSLSHACWLITYLIAGVAGALAGVQFVAVLLAAVAGAATVTAWRVWRPALPIGRDHPSPSDTAPPISTGSARGA